MDLSVYIETIPQEKISELYESKWTCQAILQILPALAQQYVLRLLYLNTPISKGQLLLWIQASNQDSQKRHSEALLKLKNLQILIYNKSMGQHIQNPSQYEKVDNGQKNDNGSGDSSGEWPLFVQPQFQSNLQRIFQLGDQNSESMQDASAQALQQRPSIEEIDLYGIQQWEDLLLFLVNERKSPPKPHHLLAKQSLDFSTAFKNCNFLGRDSTGKIKVNQNGLKFLLQDQHSQLWILLQEYINVSGKDVNLSQVLSFLFEMGFRDVGIPFPLTSLNRLQSEIAGNMTQLGILYAYKVNDQVWLCPTQLASTLCKSGNQQTHDSTKSGFLIIESNFKVYAYTNSTLKICVLKLLTREDIKLPNLYVGTITRDSISGAVENGLVGEQILSYFQHNAHPNLQYKSRVIPEAVSDQVGLWESENFRAKYEDTYLYQDFPSQQIFQLTVNRAAKTNKLVWYSDQQQKLVAHLSGHDDLRAYIKHIREKYKDQK